MKHAHLFAVATVVVSLLESGGAFAAEAAQGTQAGSTTREELTAANQAGTLIQGEATTLPATPMSTRSRAVVIAETLEALRLGAAQVSEANLPSPTPAQLELIRQAGLRASRSSVAASHSPS